MVWAKNNNLHIEQEEQEQEKQEQEEKEQEEKADQETASRCMEWAKNKLHGVR